MKKKKKGCYWCANREGLKCLNPPDPTKCPNCGLSEIDGFYDHVYNGQCYPLNEKYLKRIHIGIFFLNGENIKQKFYYGETCANFKPKMWRIS